MRDKIKLFKKLNELDLYPNIDYPLLNRTRIYLLPAILKHNKILINELSKYKFVATGLYDKDNEDKFSDTTIGYLINARQSKFDVNIVDTIPQIVDHYYFGEQLFGDLHMLILELPKKYIKAKEYFMKSQYSKMYEDPKEVLNINRKSKRLKEIQNKAVQVCLKDKSLIDKLDTELSDHIVSKNLSINPDLELDSKIDLKQEVFNYT